MDKKEKCISVLKDVVLPKIPQCPATNKVMTLEEMENEFSRVVPNIPSCPPPPPLRHIKESKDSPEPPKCICPDECHDEACPVCIPEGDTSYRLNSKLPQSFDARDWAKEFVETVKRNPEIATDEGTMITWFANSLMSGYDYARFGKWDK